MASNKVNVLEQSTRESSTAKPSLNPGSATNSRESPPPIVPLNTTESNNSQSTRLLDDSRPLYSTIGLTVPANGQTIGPEENQEQMADDACCTFLECYKNAAMDFRSSCHVHILHCLITYIPIASIIVGWTNSHECPQISFLPMFVLAVGVIGLVFMAFGIIVSCCEFHGTPCSRLVKYALGVFFALFFLLLIIEMHIVFHISPNFDESAEDYCNKTFYYYVLCKEIVSVVALIVAFLIYFPGSRLHTCCLNMPMPSPASAFFSRL